MHLDVAILIVFHFSHETGTTNTMRISPVRQQGRRASLFHGLHKMLGYCTKRVKFAGCQQKRNLRCRFQTLL